MISGDAERQKVVLYSCPCLELVCERKTCPKFVHEKTTTGRSSSHAANMFM
jgi:hypothetical protein